MSDRAVSITVNYVLGLAIATLLISGLLVATGGLLEDRTESAARAELRVIGERVAGSVAMADRLARTSGAERVEVESTAPSRVAGTEYSIELEAADEELVLTTDDGDVTVRVPVANTTALADSRAPGGDVEVVLTSNDELEVRGP